MIIFFPLSNTLILSKIADFSVLNHVKAQVGHFLQILKRGSSQNFLKNFLQKITDLREKCAYIKIYEIIYDHLFSFVKYADSEQNSGFFGPESRSSVGGFPYKCRELYSVEN